MLSLLMRKPKPPVVEEPAVLIECQTEPEPEPSAEPVRRMKQKNIKITDDVGIAFDAIAKALGMSKAALFEDMVAERLETLERQGVKVELAA